MKKLWLMMIALLVALPLVAQDVEIRDDHPDEYVVREGDTLWDIAGRFLTRPWQWPAIWQANPEIDNPHLIYPGDRISLVYVDGEPRLVMDGTRRLSPEIRREDASGPISTIPLEAIEPFLVKPRVVTSDELEQLPYVVANEDRRYVAAEPDRSFIRGLDGARVNDEFMIARLSFQFERTENDDGSSIRQNRMRANLGAVPSGERPVSAGARRFNPFDRGGEVIGYQLWEVARARVLATGEPATVEILDADYEVRAGDYLLPVDPYIYDLTFYPQPPEFDIPANARVIGIHGGDVEVGHFQIVALEIGTDDGVEPGHTFSVFHPGETVRDGFYEGLRGRPAPRGIDGGKKVDLPEQYSGLVMVFRAFDQVSYALVMDGMRGVREGDRLAHPDRRL